MRQYDERETRRLHADAAKIPGANALIMVHEGPATLVVGEVVAWSASQQRTAEAARAPEAGEARAV